MIKEWDTLVPLWYIITINSFQLDDVLYNWSLCFINLESFKKKMNTAFDVAVSFVIFEWICVYCLVMALIRLERFLFFGWNKLVLSQTKEMLRSVKYFYVIQFRLSLREYYINLFLRQINNTPSYTYYLPYYFAVHCSIWRYYWF